MLRVMLVDDEPFILQGLSVLIDWNGLGFEIVKTAANGLEALEFLKKDEVDLRISGCLVCRGWSFWKMCGKAV